MPHVNVPFTRLHHKKTHTHIKKEKTRCSQKRAHNPLLKLSTRFCHLSGRQYICFILFTPGNADWRCRRRACIDGGVLEVRFPGAACVLSPDSGHADTSHLPYRTPVQSKWFMQRTKNTDTQVSQQPFFFSCPKRYVASPSVDTRWSKQNSMKINERGGGLCELNARYNVKACTGPAATKVLLCLS